MTSALFLTKRLPTPWLAFLCMNLATILTTRLQSSPTSLILLLLQVPPCQWSLPWFFYILTGNGGPAICPDRLADSYPVPLCCKQLPPDLPKWHLCFLEPSTPCSHLQGCLALSNKGSPIIKSASNQVYMIDIVFVLSHWQQWYGLYFIPLTPKEWALIYQQLKLLGTAACCDMKVFHGFKQNWDWLEP